MLFAYKVTIVVNDSRKSQRFNLKLPMTLLRCAGQAVDQPSETANISSTGVLFKTGLPMEVGWPLEYLLTLSPATGLRKPVHLHCLGKVVRQAETDVIAATIERYEFVRPS